MRLRCSRARRGPRVAAPATVARAERITSETLATAAELPRPGLVGVTTEVEPVVWRTPVPVTVVTGAEPVAVVDGIGPLVVVADGGCTEAGSTAALAVTGPVTAGGCCGCTDAGVDSHPGAGGA